jgi:chemotaxis protein methyltransferase CheR
VIPGITRRDARPKSTRHQIIVNDSDCVEFLQWCLPRLRMRWAGFRKVRRQVCKRISRRMAGLHLPDADAYRKYLEENDGEWESLGALCRVTISRFYRDRGVYDALRGRVLPRLAENATARGAGCVRFWSAGCASGEEPYTLRIVWQDLRDKLPGDILPLEIVATDADSFLLDRARTGRYRRGSVKDLPPDLLAAAFREDNGEFVIHDSFKNGIEFLQQDIRRESPVGPFDLVLCRNVAFTYFDASLQCSVLNVIRQTLRPGGYLVVGVHETLPTISAGTELDPMESAPGVFRLAPAHPAA